METNMNERIIDQLRNAASVPGKEKTWISELTDQQLLEIYVKLKNGISAHNIAIYVRDSWKILTKSSPHSIAQGIIKFKKRIAHLLNVSCQETQQMPLPSIPDIPPYESSLESLEDLANKLDKRIRDILQEERQTGTRFPINKEINALSSLRKTILKQKQWELMHSNDDPMLLRKQKRDDERLRRSFDLMRSQLTDGGSVVAEMARRFIELAEKESVTMTYDEKTGRYKPVEEETAKETQ